MAYTLRYEEELKLAEQALAGQPENVKDAVSEFVMMATANIPEDQRDLIKARLVSGIIGALPKAAEALKFRIEDIIRPTKMQSGKFTIIELRPELFNKTTFRYNYTSTGAQSCPWNVKTAEGTYLIIVGFQNPEPSPKTRLIYGKIGVDDLPTYYVGDLSGFRVKVLPRPFDVKPRSDIDLTVYVDATGYDELRPFGAAIVSAVDATKLSPWSF